MTEKTLIALAAVAGLLVGAVILLAHFAEPCKNCHVSPPPPPPPSINIIINNNFINSITNVVNVVQPAPVVVMTPPCVGKWIPVAKLETPRVIMTLDCRRAVCLDGSNSQEVWDGCGSGNPSEQKPRIVKWRFEVRKEGKILTVSEGGDPKVTLVIGEGFGLEYVLIVTDSNKRMSRTSW